VAGRLIVYLLIAVLIVGLSVSQVSAKNHSDGKSNQQVQIIGPRRQLVTIIFSGLAGGVLGLSTLSFYHRPQDKLSNISIGAAIGVIVGTAYTTYQTATRPQSHYETMLPQMELEQIFSSQQDALSEQDLSQLQLSWEWSF